MIPDFARGYLELKWKWEGHHHVGCLTYFIEQSTVLGFPLVPEIFKVKVEKLK